MLAKEEMLIFIIVSGITLETFEIIMRDEPFLVERLFTHEHIQEDKNEKNFINLSENQTILGDGTNNIIIKV